MLHQLFPENPEVARTWFSNPRPRYGNLSALDYINSGDKVKRVAEVYSILLEDLING